MLENIEVTSDLGFEDFSVHNDIEILRIRDDPYDKGIWAKQPILPKWDKIIELCQNNLKKSRDLTIACRLTEALVNKYGIDGLKIGLNTIQNLYHGEFYPLNKEYRERNFQWIDQKLPIIAFYENFINYEYANQKALSDLSASLNEIRDILLNLNKLANCFTGNFLQIIDNILTKISSHQTEEKINEMSSEDNLINLINEFNNLMPNERERLKKILLQNHK